MLSALLLATRQHLLNQADFPLTADEIEVLPDRKPPPRIGKQFLSIYGVDWSPGPESDMHRGLCEKFGVGCTLTMRAHGLSYEATGRQTYVEAAHAMEPIIRRIIVAIHQNISLITLANTLAQHTYTPTLQTYLRWKSCDARPRMVGPEWFWANPMSNTTTPEVGLIMEVTFGDALQYMSYSAMR